MRLDRDQKQNRKSNEETPDHQQHAERPPGLSVSSDKKLLERNQEKVYSLSVHSYQLGILFIERTVNLLKEGGILVIILPSGYLNNQSLKYIKAIILLINNEDYYKFSLQKLLPRNCFIISRN